MRAGEFDHPVYIQQNTGVLDPTYGTITDNWVSIINEAGSPTVPIPIWAQFQDVLPSRSEAVAQGLQVARNQTRLRIRYRSGITSDMRVVDAIDGTIYNIVGGPAVIGRKEFQEMVIERYTP